MTAVAAGQSSPVSGPRLAVVWCPDWPVVAAGAAPHEPVAVLHANRVVARTPSAAVSGVRQGHRRREAQRICPTLRIIDHDPARDGREFEVAIHRVGEMVPRLEITEPGLLTFLARGPARYFGGELAMAQRVNSLLAAALPHACIGIGLADGRFAAGIAAQQSVSAGGPVVVKAGFEPTRAFLHPLQVHLLRDIAGIAPDFIDLLHRLGVRSLGDLAALPRPDLLARFGTIGAFAHRLASGADDRPPGSLAPPPELVVSRVFEDPVQLLDPLVFAGKQLAQELHGLLSNAGQVCTRLAVVAETEYGERCEHLWYRPNGLSAAAIAERVRWQLDGWIQQPGGLTGGIVLLRFIPDEIRSDNGNQLGFWGGRSEADDWATRAVARVVGLVGEQHVLVPAYTGGRQPGDMFHWRGVDRADVSEPGDRFTISNVPWPGSLPAPSPAVVLADPLTAEVVDAFGRMVSVSGRGALSNNPARLSINGGPAQPIVSWAGPWPVDERWWDPQHHRRLARFQLITENGSAVLAVVEHQRWWVTAFYG